MNKHFEDALYYLKRAGEHTILGAKETLQPIEERVRELTGRNPEPESDQKRFEAVLEDVTSAERKVESEAREAIGSARRRVGTFRSRQ